LLRELAPGLWVAEQPQRFGGLELGTRMSVVRVGATDLLIHSPISISNELVGALGRLGRVRWIVAPNRFHHLHAGPFTRRFPDAALLGAPGLGAKRPDLRIDAILPEGADPKWDGLIEAALVEGSSLLNEVVFLHCPTRSLIASDLAFNIGPTSPRATRWAFRLLGRYERFGPTWLEHLLMRDRAAAQRSLERILEWDFDRVVIAHGGVLDSGGRDALAAGYAWLLR
jgi:hypothetical protein